MSNDFRTLLDDAACRNEVMSSIGNHLRKQYADQVLQPVPENLQHLLQRLAVAEGRLKQT